MGKRWRGGGAMEGIAIRRYAPPDITDGWMCISEPAYEIGPAPEAQEDGGDAWRAGSLHSRTIDSTTRSTASHGSRARASSGHSGGTGTWEIMGWMGRVSGSS